MVNITVQAQQPAVKRADVLLHPVRLRILNTLHAQELTPTQIGASLPEVPQATLYRHLRQLLEAGLVRVVSERQAHGAVERVYAVVESATYLTPTEKAAITGEEFSRHFRAFVSLLLAAMNRYVRQRSINLEEDKVIMAEKSVYLTPDEAVALRQHVRQVLQEALDNAPTPERRRYTLATILLPEPVNTPASAEGQADSRD